jgi:restriction system protein
LGKGKRVLAKQSKGSPEFVRWMGPLLDCLRAVGGSARPKEVSTWIARELRLSDDVINSTLKSGANRFHNQVQWARQYLVWQGLIDDAARGVWKLTPLGWQTHLDLESARAVFVHRHQLSKSLPQSIEAQITTPDAPHPTEQQEQDLLGVLKGLSARGFELICERLLREHGFEDVEVTQQSRDGGIDGYGVLRLSPFVSLKVAFQAKKYKEVVSRSAVGEFRNAFLGRAEKGVFITTGRFTSDAEAEAARDGVPPIELIDGERLVELFEEAKLGVKMKQIFDIDFAFFDQFRSIKE